MKREVFEKKEKGKRKKEKGKREKGVNPETLKRNSPDALPNVQIYQHTNVPMYQPEHPNTGTP